MSRPMTPGWRGNPVVGERQADGSIVWCAPTAREIAAVLADDPVLKAEVLRELGAVPHFEGDDIADPDGWAALVANVDLRQPGDTLLLPVSR